MSGPPNDQVNPEEIESLTKEVKTAITAMELILTKKGKEEETSADDCVTVKNAEKTMEAFEARVKAWMKTLKTLMDLRAFIQVLHEKYTLFQVMEQPGAFGVRNAPSELKVPKSDAADDVAGPHHAYVVRKMEEMVKLEYNPAHRARNPDLGFMTEPIEEITREERSTIASLLLFRLKQVFESYISDPKAREEVSGSEDEEDEEEDPKAGEDVPGSEDDEKVSGSEEEEDPKAGEDVPGSEDDEKVSGSEDEEDEEEDPKAGKDVPGSEDDKKVSGSEEDEDEEEDPKAGEDVPGSEEEEYISDSEEEEEKVPKKRRRCQ